MPEEWISTSEAWIRLNNEGFKISLSKLASLKKQQIIRNKRNPMDRRVKLVEINEIKQLFNYSN